MTIFIHDVDFQIPLGCAVSPKFLGDPIQLGIRRVQRRVGADHCRLAVRVWTRRLDEVEWHWT